ncbi:hypothetical protein Ddye_018910 [Dipteronia dyeriana]|uniref:Uncharacterized protein n=1 Tax=Dipteronia dyeriana TaxID=168575 RepID=A0AAD9TWU3_9ROSI|nr:hypothetical protein Ddye_018910 [Dipteronia dyeriana]
MGALCTIQISRSAPEEKSDLASYLARSLVKYLRPHPIRRRFYFIYFLSPTPPNTTSTSCPRHNSRGAKSSSFLARKSVSTKAVLEGHVPLYISEEIESFQVSAKLLNHLVFVGMLNHSIIERRPSIKRRENADQPRLVTIHRGGAGDASSSHEIQC